MSKKFIPLLILIIVVYGGVAFQSAPPQLDSLKVELWPEYDRAETLVIYKGNLVANTPLPAQITFLLPSYVEAVHAVAVEQNGALLQIPPAEVKLNHDNQHAILTFVAPARNFQFEYYDPTILTKQGQNRQLAYRFSASFDISAVAIEVQEPAQSTDFRIEPAARQTTNDINGLTYHLVEVANLQLGSSFTLNASYQRATAATSAELLKLPASTQPATTPPNDNTFIEYSLFALACCILFGTVGYWYYRRPTKRVITPSVEAKFCHQCGTALREVATFCHNCGTPRR